MLDNELAPSSAKKREASPEERGRTKRAKERGEDDAEARAQIPEERDEEAPAGVGTPAGAAKQRKTTGGDAQDEQARRLAAGDAAATSQDFRGGCDSGPCGDEGVPKEMPQRIDLPMVEVLPMVHFQMDSVKPVSGAGAQAAGPSLAKAWPKRCFAKSGGPTTNRAAEQLQCPKCSHAYNTQTAPPLLLPCLHSLCSPCAAADQLRICPQCDFPYEFFSPVASSSEVWGGVSEFCWRVRTRHSLKSAPSWPFCGAGPCSVGSARRSAATKGPFAQSVILSYAVFARRTIGGPSSQKLTQSRPWIKSSASSTARLGVKSRVPYIAREGGRGKKGARGQREGVEGG